MTPDDLLDEIQRTRALNNTNWMDLSRLAWRVDPKKAQEISRRISERDQEIVDLNRQLSELPLADEASCRTVQRDGHAPMAEIRASDLFLAITAHPFLGVLLKSLGDDLEAVLSDMAGCGPEPTGSAAILKKWSLEQGR